MFSKTTEYALRATIFIAQKGSKENKLSIEEISKAIDSPHSFTAKILQVLSKENKLVSSVRGPNGGFYLTEKAKKFPVSTILEIMEESDIFNKCVLGLHLCSETKPCPLHFQYKPIKQQLIDLFETKSILTLSNEINAGEAVICNSVKKLKSGRIK